MDPSHGYEGIADRFLQARSLTGAATVRAWAEGLPRGGRVLDLGCGSGEPVTRVLAEAGLDVYGIDASPTLVQVFRDKLPEVPVRCEDVLTSDFFGLTYDAIVAIGLVFLLDEVAQKQLLRKCVAHLRADSGRDAPLLFSAPREAVEWEDVLTGRLSRSLGEAGYRDALQGLDLQVDNYGTDEGGNAYFNLRRC